ncbi:Heparinase II/III-like protein [Gracilibacillus ureilyticus]|uniref:Heparinase II/III-like protein n=1 Tax=Gracilibacillus ureilyticus TaxID=531814 RepID=A0A1H9PMN0_9BACI|nr:heparinase II/III family protein [Gracilibacillus ureilyticus]SER49462.1 Heparinase II/III-like protein [Gracilibacillus ureilyticus]
MINRVYWESIDRTRIDTEIITSLKENADKFREKPLVEMTFQTYRQFHQTGDREEFERCYFGRRKRLTTYGLLAYIYPENNDYLLLLENELWQVCQEFTWSLSAHINQDLEEQSYEDFRNNYSLRYTIDLFAAETAFTLAELLHIFTNRLDQFLIEKVRIEIYRRVLKEFIENGQLHWETSTHNWAAVCAGSIGSAAIYIMGEDPGLGEVLDRVNQTMEYYLSGFKADGACMEGFNYWQYGFGYFVYYIDLFEKYTGKASDFWERRKVKEISLFQQKVFLANNDTVNFSDAYRRAKPMLGFTQYLHKKFSEVHIHSDHFSQKEIIDHCGRWAPAFRELIWSKPETGSDWPEADYLLADSAIMVSRLMKKNRTFAFAAKGGNNDEPHNHNDIGHFILFSGNQYFLKDLGAGQYNKDYFGEARYHFICNSSAGHSVPVINGFTQSAGANYYAKLKTAAVNENTNLFSLQMEKAYDDPILTSYNRTFSWEKQEPRLILEDVFSFSETPVSLIETFILEDMTYEIFDHYIIFYQKNESFRISFHSITGNKNIERKCFINHYGEEEYFLVFHLEVLDLQQWTKVSFTFEWLTG